jgi:hypothetical protein
MKEPLLQAFRLEGSNWSVFMGLEQIDVISIFKSLGSLNKFSSE